MHDKPAASAMACGGAPADPELAVEVLPDDHHQRPFPLPSPSSSPAAAADAMSAADIRDIRALLWGADINADTFARWSQGFVFSAAEPSALVQYQGGPCAVIAPVQAFVLLQLLSAEPPAGATETAATGGDRRQLDAGRLAALSADRCRTLLVQALCTILGKCQAGQGLDQPGATAATATSRFRIVTMRRPAPARSTAPVSPSSSSSSSGGSGRSPTRSDPLVDDDEGASAFTDADCDAATPSPAAGDADTAAAEQRTHPDAGDFHRRLCCLQLDSVAEVQAYYTAHAASLQCTYGVLLFMYSVLLTKRLAAIEAELLDTSEPLIHEVYGYASQGLINLMLTGRAVPNVWDNDQDVGGLKLKGIDRQSDVGFITLMEQMRYCTVGSFYKNPCWPVWVMGSETHLTVLCSDERRLVSPETSGEIGRRVFKSFDPDGNNFIATTSLQVVLQALDLVSETEYVELMQKRLDPEGLGIILLNSFMDEFFCAADRPSVPDTFDLLHYNGIPGSNDGQLVRYHRGSAVLLESDLKTMCQPSNPMLTCLQTKWPAIEVNWSTGSSGKQMPSLN